MHSPLVQAAHQQRLRGNSIHPLQAINNHGAVRKRTLSGRSRSDSASHAQRLHNLLAVDQSPDSTSHAVPPPTSGLRWPTPQHSPQPQPIFADPSVEPFPTWTVPTPPRSDSGIPIVSVDANDEPVRTSIRASNGFQFEQPTTSAEMRSARVPAVISLVRAMLTIDQLVRLLVAFSVRIQHVRIRTRQSVFPVANLNLDLG